MKQKAVFLDRDGTINVEKDYLYKIDEFEFLPGVIEALRLLQDANYLLIIITNQSGIARGFYSVDDYKKLNVWMLEELKKNSVDISAVYYCPHHPSAKINKYRIDCDCRKPKLGMFEKAIMDFDLDVNSCYTIGDRIRDSAICESTNCHGYLIGQTEKPDLIEEVKQGIFARIKYSSSLLEAAKDIISKQT